MTKLSDKELAAGEKTRDLNAELLQSLQELKRGEWARKTEFITQMDGWVGGSIVGTAAIFSG